MKRLLTGVLVLSLLNSAAVVAQPDNRNRADQSSRQNDQNGNDQKGSDKAAKSKGRNRDATAAPAAQVAPKSATTATPSSQATRDRSRPTAPSSQAARDRSQPTAPSSQAARDRSQPSAPSSQAARDRSRPTAPSSRAARDRTQPAAPRSQAARARTAPPTASVQDQNRYQDLRNNPSFRVGTPRFSRGDRLPDQYRQNNQYFVSDWQQQGLRQPPRGYRWVRDDNNNFFLALIATGMIAQVVYRNDRDQMWRQHYSREYTYNDDIYYQDCRSAPDPAGIIAGALIGGLLGNAAGNGRPGATLAGVIVGGTVGAALTSNLDCQDRSYAYKTYYDGFNSGRPGSRYEWRNPSNGHYGNLRIVSYANDPYGFRCANFTQTIYIEGRPQLARGRACRQPDGTWAIVG